MKLNYDRVEDILTLETEAIGVLDHAQQVGNFIAHFSEDGQLLVLESLDAGEFLADRLKSTLRNPDERRIISN